MEPPVAFSASGVVEPPERWWTAFGDPALDRLVERALAGNLELAEVWQRLREARAVADREASDLYPDVDGFADGSVFRSSGEEDGFGRGFDGDDGDGGTGGDFQDEELRLGLTATYEVDLWGRIRSRVEAERFRAGAGLEDYRTAALTLSAEVARTWFQWVEARDQVALLDEQVEANRQILELLENRFANGQIRGVDVLRQRQLVEATRELRIEAEARAALLEHLLAVLLGRSPQDFDAAASSDPALPPLPPLPETGLPAELVRRRPDVRAAWLRVEAADRDLAAAIARRYPRLTLGAGADLDALDLFDAWTRSLTADLLAPLFRAGELEADAERAEAVRRQAVLRYGQATLTAFREVEDALVREAAQRERVDSLERQNTLSEQALERLRMQYLNGLGDYIDVLTALTGAQRVRRDLLVARRQLLEDRVLLYRALAGGFDSRPEAGPGSVPETGPESGREIGSESNAERNAEGNARAEGEIDRPPARKPGTPGDVEGSVSVQKPTEPHPAPAGAATPPPAEGSSPIRTRGPAPRGAEKPAPPPTAPAPRPPAPPAGGGDLHRETP